MAPRSQNHFRLINFLARQRKPKLGQVDTKYNSAVRPSGAFSPFGQDILAWRDLPRDQGRAAAGWTSSHARRKTARLFPSIIFPRLTDFLFSPDPGGRRQHALLFISSSLVSPHISADTFHFIATLIFDHQACTALQSLIRIKCSLGPHSARVFQVGAD